MRTLLIDNYDSFTYNLFQLLAEVNGCEPVVVRNDGATWDELAGAGFEAVVISPGPGRPDREGDFGLCGEAIERCQLPLLGVCLGHQGIGVACGGAVEAAPEPVHGRLSAVEHSGSPLFAGIPRRFEAVRYHSLQLARPLPPMLEEIAWTDDGVPMAVAHRVRPQWGVQFHPESVATEHGRRLIENFRDLAAPRSRGLPGTARPAKKPLEEMDGGMRLRRRRLDQVVDPEQAFVSLYGESHDAFWLDSSLLGDGARFSFMGDGGGPLGAVVTYDVDAREVTVTRRGEVEVLAETVFDYLERELARLRPLGAGLPFEFDCGFAGYLGYELKADCGGERAHSSPHADAALVFADRMLAFDHEKSCVYMLCLHYEDEEKQADEWLSATEARLLDLAERTTFGAVEESPGEPPRCCSTGSSSTAPHWARSEPQYLADIAECQRLLREGESYEVCLTNSARVEVGADPLDLYRCLRRLNPAPHAAYLRFGDLAVLSSSPERFLRVDRQGGAEAKPIKGTSRRGATAAEDAELATWLRADEKSRAENLMIADLLRNDLGRVCEVGSVEVPALMAVETYADVHHLVTTVRGRLRPGVGVVDCIRACFPAGSMTGAPKIRTMEIIDRLEGWARGPYSGAIGYLAGGGCDLSVAIRTVVVDGSAAGIGTGGAIVVDSNPEDELGEALLKAAAPLRAVGAVALAQR